MGISRFKLNEDPSPVLGKTDFIFWYDGSLSIYENNRIPAQSKNYDLYINQLEGEMREAPSGQAVLFTIYKNGVSLGQVSIAAGATSGSTTISRTLVSAGDVLTMTIDQVGSGRPGVSLTGYARVTT